MGLISKTTIYVVNDICRLIYIILDCSLDYRAMLVILAPCSVSRAGQSRYHTITNRRTKVSQCVEFPVTPLLISVTGEKARICAAGGFVDFGRVNGNLALSRAIGDFEFKKSAELSPEQQIVTAYPDVIAHTITDDDEFLVIACDGKHAKIDLVPRLC